MNSDWNTAIDFVLKMEVGEDYLNDSNGGYGIDPNDPGGETKWGISQKAFPQLDIKNLTLEKAKDIYLTDYWNPCHCDELPSQFAIAMFDCGVNQGTGAARRLLQMALGVRVDGNIGSYTIKAAFQASQRKVKLFLAHRLAEYNRAMIHNNKLEVFDVNWGFRVVSLAELILQKPAVL